jgi:hypothetical protein
MKAEASHCELNLPYSMVSFSHYKNIRLGVSCMESGIVVQSEKRSGWRNNIRGGGDGRARDGGGSGGRHIPERMGPDLFESDDESISDDAMDVDNHIVNPNEF